MEVICPYCGKHATLVSSESVSPHIGSCLLWRCDPCNAHVGIHKNSEQAEPLGTLAKRELRRWRQKTHRVFDLLWRDSNLAVKTMSRKEAYRFLQHISGIESKEKVHIGMFDIKTCKHVINKLAGIAALFGLSINM
jgi:hypothetical protein